MARQRVRAVTFDLWDTIFIDDSDEPKRAAAGLPPKPVERRELVHRQLARHGPVTREAVDLAYDVTDAAFLKVWRDHSATWTVSERLSVLLAGMGRELPAPELAELVKQHEEMELRYRPDPVPGVRQAVALLADRYKLGVVSDTIFSPGRALRELLAGERLLEHFAACVFSDELGHAKPAARVFEAAADALGVACSELVHIGDRPHNDVAGARSVGARAILLTAVKDREGAGERADAVCDDYAELAAILRKWD